MSAHAIPRHRIEAAIESLIALLDASEPDPDLEPQGDDEPWLGWTSTMAHGNNEDREDGDDNGIADYFAIEEQGLGDVGLAAIHAQMGRQEPIIGRFIPVAEYDKAGRVA